MFLNSIQQQQNGTMSAVQQKRARNSFALQRNLEWGEFPYTGLNIVPVPQLMSQVIQQRMITDVCWFMLCIQKVIPPKK